MGRHPRMDRGQRKASAGRHRGATRRARAWLLVRRGNRGRRRGRRRAQGRRNEGRGVTDTAKATIHTMLTEYDALKAVEAAVREAVRIFDTADVFATCDAIEHGVRDALAALDAIRKGPGNGKTGEAR